MGSLGWWFTVVMWVSYQAKVGEGGVCLRTQTINCGHRVCCSIGLPMNELTCWGSDGNYQISGRPDYGVMAVSCSFWACCAVVKGTLGVKCWGGDAFDEAPL